MALRFPATSDASLRIPEAGVTKFPQYRNVSNFNVGLFCQQAGLSFEDHARGRWTVCHCLVEQYDACKALRLRSANR
jgi:hypothetical protein